VVVELDEGYFGVGVDEGLLIDAADALEGANIVSILCAKVTGVQALDFPVGFLLGFGLLKRS